VFLNCGRISRLKISSKLLADVGGVLFRIYHPVWPTVTGDENILRRLFVCYLFVVKRRNFAESVSGIHRITRINNVNF
jgi:hypothetical protein